MYACMHMYIHISVCVLYICVVCMCDIVCIGIVLLCVYKCVYIVYTLAYNTGQSVFTYSNDPASAKLRYTIVYNSSRALRFQQIYIGSLNKPDGRTGICL